MASSILETGLDLVSIILDLQTKSAVHRLGMGRGGIASGGSKEKGAFITLVERVVREVGLGKEDEGKLEIEIGKMTDPDQKKTIQHLLDILDKEQLKRLRLIAFNAPQEVEKAEKIKAKKGKDGVESEPEREIITHKAKSGTLLFLESLAANLAGKSDAEQIAYLKKRNHITEPFMDGAMKTIEKKIRKGFDIDPDTEITLELILDKLEGEDKEEDLKPVRMWPFKYFVHALLFGAKDEAELAIIPLCIKDRFKPKPRLRPPLRRDR